MKFDGPIRGVYVALVSPFLPSGELDSEAFASHMAWLEKNGVTGFVPCGTTGESATLSSSERTALIRATADYTRGKKLNTIAGCGGNETEAVIASVKEAADLGSDAALVVTPYYNKPTQAGLIQHYIKIADASPVPIVLYNIPSRTGVGLNVETLVTLSEHPKIIGLKESTDQHARWMSLAEKLPLSRFALLAGDDDAFATMLGLGASGIISASANVAPAQFVKIYELAEQGRLRDAFRLQLKLSNLVRSLFIETNPAPSKYALSTMGKMAPNVRLPLVELLPESKKVLEGALKNLEAVT